MRLRQCKFWAIRTRLLYGERYVFLTSVSAVRQVLVHAKRFHRCTMDEATITSPHSILGAGGLSEVWARIRPICVSSSSGWTLVTILTSAAVSPHKLVPCSQEPYFNESGFHERTSHCVHHVHAVLAAAARAQQETGEPIDWFQLVNRLVVESHLVVLLGIDVPAGGLQLPTSEGAA